MRLFLAKVDGGNWRRFIDSQVGKAIHYMWGASNRAYSKLRGVSEAVQWGVIEWAMAEGCTLYDLEGIDPINNPGSYQFKKKWAAVRWFLQCKSSHSLSWRGAVIQLAGRLTVRI